jgi:hypothetical protein
MGGIYDCYIAGQDLAPVSRKLAGQMIVFWTSFAKTGKPSAPNTPF